MINLDYVSVPARGSGMNHATSGGSVDFGSIRLDEVDARMQRKATEEWIGAIAEGRREARLAGKRHTQGHEGHKRLEALGRRHVARDAHERRIERGRFRIKVGRDIVAAHPALVGGRGELPWIEPGLGHNRLIARGGPFSGAVDSAESLRLVALYPVERAIDERKARRGVEVL